MIELPPMVTVPAGTFVMGTNGGDRFANSTERPAHTVTITVPFEVSCFPITEHQWHAFKGPGPISNLPVVRVSWHDAMDYVAWLSRQTQRAFRLLTENEWEYCCRAGSSTVFACGDALEPAHANYLYDEHGFKVGPGKRTTSGTYPQNSFGLEDMHGNVCEWVGDVWRPAYDADARADARVIRGGAWDYQPRLLRSAWRDFALPEVRRDNLGFRVACDH